MQHSTWLLVVLAGLVTGCTVTPPTSPSETTPTVPLTIRVGTRGTEAPLAGATVTITAPRFTQAGVTTSSGELLVTVPMGDLEVTATASGYAPMTAAGTVRSAERWTFFLEAR